MLNEAAIPDSHPLACGVLGRSGTPVASATMTRSNLLLVLGASFSNHTSITTKRAVIQQVTPQSHPERRDYVARLWACWRADKAKRASRV